MSVSRLFFVFTVLVGAPSYAAEKNPLVDVIVRIGKHQQVPYGVTAHSACLNELDSSKSAAVTGLLNGITNGTYATYEDYRGAVSETASGWTPFEKACLAAKSIGYWNGAYNSDQTFKKMSREDVYQGRLDGTGAGVCIQLHASGADICKAMGMKSGTVGGQWIQGIDIGNHAVAVCQDPATGQTFMSNYGEVFELSGKTFQQAMDESNWILGGMSVSGSLLSCVDETGKTFKQCNHDYMPKDARWAASVFKKGAERIRDEQPIGVEIGSERLRAEIAAAAVSENGVTAGGAFVVAEHHLPTQATAIATGLALDVRSDAKKPEAKNAIAVKTFLAEYLVSRPNALPGVYVSKDNITVSGLMLHLDVNGRIRIAKRTQLEGRAEAYAQMDGSAQSFGISDHVELAVLQQLGKGDSIRVSHRASINGSTVNNRPIFNPEVTTLENVLSAETPSGSLKVKNTARVLLLHSPDSTFAFELSPEVEARISELLTARGEFDIGYTLPSDDWFYEPGLFYDGTVSLTGRVPTRAVAGGATKPQFEVGLYGSVVSGERPQYFYDEDAGYMLIDDHEKLTPGMNRGRGLEGGVVVKGAF